MSQKLENHIALSVEPSAALVPSTRKSLRRSWNQLPRCQRNLIIIGVLAACVTCLFLLPDHAQMTDDGGRSSALTGVFPVRTSREGDEHHADPLKAPQQPIDEGALPNMPHHNADEVHQAIDAPQMHDAKPPANAPAPPESGESRTYNDDALAAPSANKANIAEVPLDNNRLEEPPGVDAVSRDRVVIEVAVQEPLRLPVPNGRTIEEFVQHLVASGGAAQKQHFHGATNERQEAVVAAFKHSWTGYKKFAWGHDNLKPISQSSHDWFSLGLTIVDALDTMYIMGLDDEFVEARDWVSEFLTFDINRDVNLFEVTIRVLGGLLASYHLSGETVFLKKSVELGTRLLPCFLSPSSIPYSDVNLASLSAHSPKWSPDSSTSEVTTIQLEFRDLSRVTNASIYERVVQTVNEKVHSLEKKNGLVPIFINANTGTFRSYSTISMGARGDSYYEYLLKQWIQTGRKENDELSSDYSAAIEGVLTQLMRRTPREQHVYLGELINGKDFKPKMDHLTCYLPGTLLLGHRYGMPDTHLALASDLLETCYQTYMKQPTHLAPEISYFAVNDNEEHEIYVKPNDAHNLLRPEFVESLYYFYVLTGNRTYQDMGWTIFQAFEKHTKVANGYTSINNVKSVLNLRLRDMMESFWLGETLKYFYLLFSDNRKEIDLDRWVFNTEAHPLPIRNH